MKIPVIELGKNDIIVTNVGRTPVPQAEAYARKMSKMLNYRYEHPIIMPIREFNGLAIIKRPHAEEFPLFSQEKWDEQLKNEMIDKENRKKDTILALDQQRGETKRDIKNEIDRLQKELDKIGVDLT